MSDGFPACDFLEREPGIGLCWVCGEPADYVDIDFVAPVCGGICAWAGWEAYRLACAGRDPW